MGWNPLDTISDIGNAALNIGVNTLSGGLVGYDPNGGGITTNAGITSRGLDEISGRADQREEDYNKRVVADAATAQQKLMDEQNERARQLDVNASSSARAIRATAGARSGGGFSSSMNSDERDFLGL